MKIFLLFLAALFINICGAQQVLKVEVVDSITNEPLPFATLYLQEIGKGTTTDIFGEATFSIRKTKLTKDTLVCSYIGFTNKKIPLALGDGKKIIVQLSSSTTTLDEVEIMYKKQLTAKKILKNTLKNTTKNYSQTPVNFRGLYRELMQENGHYIYINEAVVEMHYTKYTQNSIDRKAYNKWQYDCSYAYEFKYSQFHGFPNQFNTIYDQVRIIESRSSASNSINNLDVAITGHPLELTAKDYIKYRYDFLNPRTLNNYIYTKKENERVNNKSCYVIEFHPKASTKKVIFNYIFKNKNGIYTGQMYIDKASFAIVKVDFQLLQSFDYGFYQLFIPLDSRITILYQELGNKWYLHNIKLKQTNKVYIAKTKEASLVNSYQELFINEVATDSVHTISENDEWKHTKQVQLRNLEADYNPDFWRTYESETYPKLTYKIKHDLESKTPLSEQYSNRFKRQENLAIAVADKMETIFNYPTDTLIDYYQWFSFPEKRLPFFNYLEAENEYATNYLIPQRKTQKRIFNNLNNFYLEDTTKQKRTYKQGDLYSKEDSLGSLQLYECKDSVSCQSILDYGSFKKKRPNSYILSRIKASKNNLAINYTNNGGLNKSLIIQAKSSEIILDSISEIYSYEWYSDSLLLYTKENKTHRSDKLFCRNVYTHHDSLLLYELDSTFDISVYKTHTNIICNVTSMNENELLITKPSKDYPKFELLFKRTPDILSAIKEYDNQLYVLTNKNAPNYKVSVIESGTLKDVIVLKSDVYISDFIITENYYVVNTIKNSFIDVRYKKKTDKKWSAIDFPTDIFNIELYESKNDKISFSYSAPNTPYTLYDYDLNTEILLAKNVEKLKYPYIHTVRDIAVDRLWAKAIDGAKVPVTLISGRNSLKEHKGLILKAYGMYGGYGAGYGFNMEDVVLLNDGYTIAYAHVRGSGVMGSGWHTDGKLLEKENTFNDYIACAEHLIKKKYTTPDYLVGYGVSAGGLLMGVVINRRPELFNTVILDHPYLDALTTMMMDTLPLTTDHYKEIGNPKEKIYYDYMKAYSPYQNIKKQDYPNLLFLASSNDYQTPTWQIAKYVAKVKEYNTGSSTILFKTDFGSGHMGSTFGNQWIKDLSFKNAFIHFNLFE